MSEILSVGFPLPNYRVDNYNMLTAPSFFDYEAIVIDPASITADAAKLMDGTGTYEGRDGRPVVNGATTAAAVSGADMIRRRAEETQRLLDNGGTLMVVARPNAVVHGLIGFEGCDRYSWLPAPAGLHWGPPLLKAAEGTTIRVVDEDHPLSNVLRNFRKNLVYRAIFDDRNAAFRAAGRVLGAGGSNVPIAVEFEVLSGRVVFLPAVSDSMGQQRTQFAEALCDVIRDLQSAAQAGEKPHWLGSIPLPGIDTAETTLTAARTARESAESELTSAEERYEELARHRRVLWESGPGLQAAVIDALRMLGFEVKEEAEGVIVEHDGKTLMLETEGSREQVVEWPYVRLQRRLEERLLKKGETHGGLIVVNGQRLTAPESRPQQFTDALRIACENYRYCLMTGATLFALVKRVLEGATDADLLGVRRRIVAAIGLIDEETAVGDKEPPTPEPLF